VRVIWKTLLKGADTIFDAPYGAKVIAVQVQKDVPVMWLMCDSENGPAKHEAHLRTTGQPIEDDIGDYVGTVQLTVERGRTAVLHAFHRQIPLALQTN
jgi:hypothetical protein